MNRKAEILTARGASAESFAYWRKSGRPVGKALELAAADKAAGRYRETGLAAFNAEGKSGGRWIESPEAAGFRFIGFADEIARKQGGGRSLDHSGWFLDPDGDGETARGAVYQMPARNGRPVYVEAIRVGSGRNAWRDESRDGAAILFIRNGRHIGEASESSYDSDYDPARFDAARGADSEAESYAEAERERQEAWRAGCNYAEEIETARQARSAFLALRRDIKASGQSAAATICEALAERQAALAEQWREAKRDAAELWAEYEWKRPQWADSYAEQYGRDPFPDGNPPLELRFAAFREGAGV